MADQNPKQQIVDKLRDVDNVMITVNSSPSVDELSAALGFTLLLNKLNKHATAVFSGDIPPAITFLEPDKTFENTVNSLRDFIIALDKEKADHLRYKVDGDMVKIFITPYRTTISQDDLEFTQGDYNVEMVLALGVTDEQHFDRALSDHGKIMHDATVASLSIGSESSEIGSINWHESDASSYSEVLISLAESLRSDKNLIDEQIATAFLTGIVAATDRFSNNQTTSKVMTMAAQLMAAGANQQLIATKLEEAQEIPSASAQPPQADQQEGQYEEQPPEEPVTDRQQPDGSMVVSHEKKGDIDDVASQVEQENQAAAVQSVNNALSQSHDDEGPDPEGVFDRHYGPQRPDQQASIDELRRDLEEARHNDQPVATTDPSGRNEMSLPTPSDQLEPMMGGTLNATTDQASQDRRREEQADRNRQVLSHSDGAQYVAAPPSDYPSLNSFDGGSSSMEDNANDMPDFEPLSRDTHTHGPTIVPPSAAQSGKPSFADMGHDDARAAIESALQLGPSTADQQAALSAAADGPSGFPPLPPIEAPMPSQQQPMPPEQPQFPPEQPPMPPEQPVGDMPPMMPPAQPMAQPDQPLPAPQQPPAQPGSELPPLPPMPDFSTLPPMPGADASGQPAPPQQVIAAEPNVDLPPMPGNGDLPPAPVQPQQPMQPNESADPSQFQIPTSQP